MYQVLAKKRNLSSKATDRTDRGSIGYVAKSAVSYSKQHIGNLVTEGIEQNTDKVSKSTAIKACCDEQVFLKPYIISSTVGSIYFGDEVAILGEIEDFYFVKLASAY